MPKKVTQLCTAIGLATVVIIIILTSLNRPARAADQCVDPGGGVCFTTIQAAIDAVGSGETVRVVAGTYNENLVITKSLTLLGGCADPACATRTPFSSIIDGGGAGSVISITNNANVTIRGFTIRNGDGTTNNGRGGGIAVDGATATIRDNLIENNVANTNAAIKGEGGGIFVVDPPGPVHIEGNTIRSNIAYSVTTGAGPGRGGAIFIQGSGATVITGNQILSNTAALTIAGSGIFAHGGGIAVDGNGIDNDTLIVQDNHIASNVAGRQLTPTDSGFALGGGLFVGGIESTSIISNEISNNIGAHQVLPGSTPFHGAGGGGIRLDGVTTALLQSNVISGNTANLDGQANGGGGIVLDQSTVTMSQNRVLGNRQNPTGSGPPGGLSAFESTVTSTNDIFARNFGGLGGNSSSTLVLINDTLANNEGGGVSVNNSTLLVTNTIVANHDDGLSVNGASTFSGDYNLLQNSNNYDGSAVQGPNDIVDQDPLFRDAANDDFHLTGNSPALDQGTSAGAPSVDFEGDARPQGAGMDIGADEFALQEVYLPVVLK